MLKASSSHLMGSAQMRQLLQNEEFKWDDFFIILFLYECKYLNWKKIFDRILTLNRKNYYL
jgi:hypothetical protein